MAINNYLIIGVNPANTETAVTVDTNVKITFAKHMDQTTLTPANLILKKVNGEIVAYALTYNSETMVAVLDPTNNLEAGTQYQLEIVGTSTGIKSITGDYMSASRSYEFTTAYGVSLSAPTSLSVTVDGGYPTLTWARPSDYDIGKILTYEIQISTSADPLQAPLWPSVGDINQTNALVLNVPKKFLEGNYYAYVRALDGTTVSDWTSIQFLVEAPATTPTEPSTGGGGGDIFSFDVVDTYPRRDDVDITPGQIIIVFSSDIDQTTITADTVYIVKKEDKANLSLIDFMTDYAPSKKVAAIIDPISTPNVVTLTTTLEKDAEYTVIVRESVKNSTGSSLGVAYHWSFVTEYTFLYGDPELVRSDIGSISSSISDKLLFKYLNETSLDAYQIVSATDVFLPTDYTDGKAPYYVHQYVRLKTAYDLLLNSQLRSNGGGAITNEVKLGDLTVKKDATTGGSITAVLASLKARLKPYIDLMHGHHNRGYAKPTVVVRGENVETYPTFMTRTEFKDLGQ